MAIPEAQLKMWSHQGAIAGSRDTYAIIKNVLESSTTPFSGRNYKVFLQGSYRNDTNIYAESDVDIVIRNDNCFQSNRTDLPPSDAAALDVAYPNATYCYPEFKADVLSVLRKAFPNAVTSGDKAFAIKTEGTRRKADVLPCIAFRRYYKFKSIVDQSFDEGICFFDKASNRISNYPHQHRENLTAKHQSSGLRLKPMIRVLKNLRSCLIERGMLAEGRAPSYYLEGLLYNVPDDKFSDSYGDTFADAINWIQLEADKTKLVTANEQFYLLRDGVKTCWPKADAEEILKAVIRLWDEW